MAVKPIPDGYHSVTPYLYIRGASDALAFYAKAFGATELMRMDWGGKIGHAEIKIGDSFIMLSDECTEMGAIGPKTLGGSGVGICLYVPDSDATVAQAVAAGATVVRPIEDQFYGDRSATIDDPFGYRWTVATHKEDVPPEEMARRVEEMKAKMAGAPG